MQSALLPLLTFLAVVMGVVAVFSLLADVFLRDKQRVQGRFLSRRASGRCPSSPTELA